MSFVAKVNKNSKITHIWKEIGVRHFAAICNPGLTRATSELHKPDGKEKLCKVCSYHLGG